MNTKGIDLQSCMVGEQLKIIQGTGEICTGRKYVCDSFIRYHGKKKG
jgi:hypothetical protein